MQVRSIVIASFLHGAVIVGVGLGVQPWLRVIRPPLEVAIVPWEEAPAVEEDFAVLEPDTPPAETPDETFQEPEFTPPPVPQPDEAAEDEQKDDHVWTEPVYATPRPPRASPDLLVRIKPRPQPDPAPAPPIVTANTQPAPVVAYVEATALAENKPPVYPAIARRRGVEGDVVLLVTVGVDGEVERVEVLKSAGVTKAHAALNRAAIAAICQWRYAPATRDGKAVQAQIQQPVEFRLR